MAHHLVPNARLLGLPRLVAPLLLLLLTACGGGHEAARAVADRVVATDAARAAITPNAARRALRAKALALRAAGLSADEVARQLLDFAEGSIYASYFPGHPDTHSLPPFLYRFYPSTGIYLGVAAGGDATYPDGVWVMGGSFGPAPVRVGAVTDFITPVEGGASVLPGTLYAPVGAQVVLQVNGGADLSLTMPPATGSADAYNQQTFSFSTPLANGSAYQVTVKSQPAGQTCTVYKGATGTLPVGAQALKVGCEFNGDLVSRSSDGQTRGSFYNSGAPVIGGADGPVGRTVDGYGEGRFIAFSSWASGVGGSTGAKRQVFWRDRLTGETLLISASASGAEGNGDSVAPAISADGLSVVFESYASNLVAGDTNGVRDVFLWSAQDRQGGVQRVSVGAGGVQANMDCYEPSVSGDGGVVAFSSSANNLTTGVATINTVNVFKRDVLAGTTTLITRGTNGKDVGGSRPMLSEDGKRLVFYSEAANLVAGDTNNLWDIFVHDQAGGAITRVSLTNGGGERNQGNESASRVVVPAISGNGRVVAFATTASNMVAGDTNGVQDVFAVDLASGLVLRASVAGNGTQGNADSPITQGERPSLSFDGSWLAFSTSASTLGTPAGNVLVRNLVSGDLRVMSNVVSNSVSAPMLSRNGAYVVFGSSTSLDPRFAGFSGLFARFTGATPAWWWLP